jgi:periplasmic protein TonB
LIGASSFMVEITAIRPRLSETDRLGVTAFASLLLHMVIILGVTFAVPKLNLAGLQTLEITIVQASSDRAPDNADFLAQANQDGGGTSDRADIARNPLPVREIGESRTIPVQRPTPRQAVPAKRSERELLTQQKSDTRVARTDPQPQRKDERIDPAQLGLPSLADNRRERSELLALMDRQYEELQKRPRVKHLDGRTKEYRYAVYEEGFRAKVMRIGNLNYPAEAKRRGIRGSLVISAKLRHDGTLVSTHLNRSSGHKILDDAAERIIKLATPYSPFPADVRAETDEIVITRTWRFNDDLTSE